MYTSSNIISYIGFRQVIRAHITTQTGYMSPYYLSKAFITNLSYYNIMGYLKIFARFTGAMTIYFIIVMSK
jgi:hypothetical protein